MNAGNPLSLSKRAIVTSVRFTGKTVNSLSKTLNDAETQTVLNFDGCEFEQVAGKKVLLIETKKQAVHRKNSSKPTNTIALVVKYWSFGIHIVHSIILDISSLCHPV